MHDWGITTSVRWKQTSAMLEFYFRFRLLRLLHYRRVILHLPTKFCPNRTIRDRAMTSYPFLRRRRRHRNSTSGFGFMTSVIWEGRNLLATKIRPDISIHGWDIATSCFWKQTSAILEFYLRLRFSVCVTIGMSFCIFLPNFVQIGPSATRVMTSYPFLKMAAVSHIELFQG